MNVLIEKPFGRPMLTRDGVTVSREVYFSDRAKNMGAQILMEASETTNRIAGDGTTGTVALSYHLLSNGVQSIAAGVHPMALKQTLLDDQATLLEHLGQLSKPIAKGQLQSVATVSSGDPALGQLIADAVEYVGSDGGILTEKAMIEDVEREYIDGYYLQTGFQALQAGKKELIDPLVIVCIRRLSSAADAIEILTKTAEAKGLKPGTIPRLLFIGNVEDVAYNTIVENINRGTIDAIIIKTPPSFGDMGKYLLDDIATYASCKPITDSTVLRDFDATYVGSLDKVVASRNETTLFADNTTEAVKTRIEELKDQISNETVDAILEKFRDRVAKLEGKIALFRIGGYTDTEKEEKEFRVEDAIHATRAAFTDGVVAGGGSTLVTLSKNKNISDLTRSALQSVFQQLLINANKSPDVGLQEALAADAGQGFDLKGDGGLVDMVKAGVLDPTLVLEQIIKNATSAVSGILTVGTSIVFENSDKPE